MRGIPALCLALSLTAPAASHAQQLYRIRPCRIHGTLAVVEGRLIVGLSGEGKASTEWTLPPGWNPGPAALSLSGAPVYNARLVGYDPRSGAVVLTKSDPGEVPCAWRVVQQPDGPGLYLRAAAGKSEGWYMTVAEEAERATDSDGEPYSFHRVFLSEKPTRRSAWTISEIGK